MSSASASAPLGERPAAMPGQADVSSAKGSRPTSRAVARAALGGRRPTVQDVARDAGVSAMSVSRVLSGHPDVSPEMRHKVLRSVARLDYHRNENARSLRPGQSSRMVGVVVTNLENPYYAQVLLGVESALDSQGLRILVGMSHNEVHREERLIRDFLGRQVEGLIVVPTEGDENVLAPAVLGTTPLVLASREQPRVSADTVLLDDQGGTVRGMEWLISSGHQRIGFLGNAATVSTSNSRFRAYQQALQQAGLPLDERLVDRTCHDQTSAQRAAARLLELAEPPTAVLSASNQVTIGALSAIVPWQEQRPDQPLVQVLGVDDFSLSALISHPLAIIDHDARALGRAAAHLLLRRLGDEPNEPPARLVLPTTLRVIHEASAPG